MAEEVEGKYIRDLDELQGYADDNDILLIEDMSTIADIDTKRITKATLFSGVALQSDVTTEKERAEGVEEQLSKDISTISDAESDLSDKVTTIEGKIPAQASSTNQLADKAFVNSSIETATAEFKGTFTSLDELKKTSANKNDYAYYNYTDEKGNNIYDRYKYTDSGWIEEYKINSTTFTEAQWKAINSGATTDNIKSIDDKQPMLVSGTNIKTINKESLLGSGDIDINSAIWGNVEGTIEDQTDLVEYIDDKVADFVEVSEAPTVGKLWFNSATTLEDDYVYTKGEVDALLKEIVDKFTPPEGYQYLIVKSKSSS